MLAAPIQSILYFMQSRCWVLCINIKCPYPAFGLVYFGVCVSSVLPHITEKAVLWPVHLGTLCKDKSLSVFVLPSSVNHTCCLCLIGWRTECPLIVAVHRVLPGSGNNWVSRKYLICFPIASSKESPKRLPEVSIASFVSEQSGYSPWELESERDNREKFKRIWSWREVCNKILLRGTPESTDQTV